MEEPAFVQQANINWVDLLREIKPANLLSQQAFGTLLLIVLSLLLTLLGFVSSNISSFVKLNPAKVGLTDFQLWTVFTGGFYESNVLKYLALMSLIIPLAYNIEKLWGWKRFMAFYVIVSLLSAFCSSAAKVAEYLLVDEKYLFDDIYGLAGIAMSLLIAMTAESPEQSTPIEIIKTRHLPLIFGLSYVVLWLIGAQLNDLLLMLFSFPLSIAYLRRFDKNDTSDQVTLDLFFPSILRPYIIALVMIICRSQPNSYISSQSTPVSRIPKVIGSDPVSERRRARALKALDKKLAEISNEPEISLDGNDFENENESS